MLGINRLKARDGGGYGLSLMALKDTIGKPHESGKINSSSKPH
jgi:hypothetical protein